MFGISYFTYVLSFCLVVGSVALLILLLIGDRCRIGFWGGFAMSLAACGVAIIGQNYASLLDWLILGMTGGSLAASLFLVGMLCMVAVMAWNYMATGGRQLVR